MAKVVLVALKLPNNNFVFQRRDEKARVSPGKLGFFGGHVEEKEDYQDAVLREMKEETNLNINDLKYVSSFKLKRYDGPDEENKYYLYQMEIPSENFEFYEGAGIESYSKKDALERNDLTNSSRHSLESFV